MYIWGLAHPDGEKNNYSVGTYTMPWRGAIHASLAEQDKGCNVV